MYRKITISCFLFIIFFFTPIFTSLAFAISSFPGAEGFGANTLGGRGGKVYEVINLNDSGTGSLRDCVNDVSNYGARTCVFRVGGTITLNSTLSITKPFLTIAGQTAPGGGITLKSNGSDIFAPRTHDIIIRYITGRPGPGGENHASQTASNGSSSLYNIIFDHCSFSWGIDSVWETWYRVFDTTIQWSFVNEGLDNAGHSKGAHSKGLMIGGYYQKYGSNSTSTGLGSYNVSVLKNLMAHNGERTPLMQLCGIGQVINNVTYNPYWSFAHQQLNCIGTGYEGTSYVNWVNNYFKKGPDTESGAMGLKIIPRDSDSDDPWSGVCSSGKAYIDGNVMDGGTFNYSFSRTCDAKKTEILTTTPAQAPNIDTFSAQSAFTKVLDEGGSSKGIDCNGNWFNRRDSVDSRVVNDVRNGTGKIIDKLSDVSGGWVNIAGGTGCTDTDKDGMPDSWETNRGLNPNNIADGTVIASNGYTNLENYLNGETSTSATTTPPISTPTPIVKLGDTEPDGDVDNADFDVWFTNKFMSLLGPTKGDFNGDNNVNGIDYVIWLINFGK